MDQIKVDQNHEDYPALAAAVAQLQRTVDFMLTQLKLEYVDDPTSTLSQKLVEDLRALLRQGKKADAIKAYRAQTGGGFEEAMAAIQKIELSLPK